MDTKSDSGRVSGAAIRSLIFFVLFYLYLWLVVDLRLLYSGGGVITNFPVFFTDWPFFRTFLSHPGGLVEYLSAFLSQLFYYSWAGALVLTLQAWLLCLCTGYVFKAINAPRLRWIRFVPPILLLVLYGRYTYHFVTTMALLVALLFVSLYLRLVAKDISQLSDSPTKRLSGKLLDLLVFLVLSVILYVLAAGACLLFAVLCAIYELLFRRRWYMCLLYVLSAASLPYFAGVLFFNVSIIDAYTDLLSFSWKILDWPSRSRMVTVVHLLYLLLPITALGLGLLQIAVKEHRFPDKRSRSGLTKAHEKSKPAKSFKFIAALISGYTTKPVLRWITESSVLFAAAGAVAFFSHNAEQKSLSTLHYYACHRMWPQVLATARRYPYSNFAANSVNRALYHAGRPGYDMFSYPQHPDALLLTAQDRDLRYWHKFDTQIDLGLMNMAEKNLVECMEIYGEHPMILKRLALINMAKANYGSARIYLGAVSNILFHADWANHYLALLQSDPNLSTDARIQHLRSISLEQDHAGLFYAKQQVFSALLEKNSQNRMAFEYLMAWYMLNKKLDKIVEDIKRLSDFDYPQIPRHYEEALLVYVYGTNKPVYLDGRPSNPDMGRQIRHFSQTFNRYGRNKRAAFRELADVYGDTYFFYHLYGFSGVKK